MEDSSDFYKGIIHCHSLYSYDSMLKIEKIYEFCKKEKLDFIILTDHDTIKGSVELKKYAVSKNDHDLAVPVAAEYKTEFGDLIVAFIDNELDYKNFDNFIKQVRKQEALTLLPHPFIGHKNIEFLYSQSDLVEVFNSRVDDANNAKALSLATKLNKKKYSSPDAHLLNEYKNSIIEVKKIGNLKESLKNGEIIFNNKNKSFGVNVIMSQTIKSLKKKNFKIFINQFKKVIKLIITRKLFSRI